MCKSYEENASGWEWREHMSDKGDLLDRVKPLPEYIHLLEKLETTNIQYHELLAAHTGSPHLVIYPF